MRQGWIMIYRSKCITLEDRRYAERLRLRRLALKLTLNQVGKAVKLAPSTLWAYEQACSRPSLAKREALEAYYSGLEAERRAAAGESAADESAAGHAELNLRTREVIGSIIDQLTALLAEANEAYFDPADAGREIKGA